MFAQAYMPQPGGVVPIYNPNPVYTAPRQNPVFAVPTHTPPRYNIGQSVQCYWKDSQYNGWFPAIIQGQNPDGTTVCFIQMAILGYLQDTATKYSTLML